MVGVAGGQAGREVGGHQHQERARRGDLVEVAGPQVVGRLQAEVGDPAGIEADPNSSLAHRDGDHLPAGGDQDQAIGGGGGGEVGGQTDGDLTARSAGGRVEGE